MTEKNAKFLTTIFLLISAPLLVYAVRQYLHADYAGMCQFLFMGLCMAAAASQPEHLMRKVSEGFRTPVGEFDELTERTALGDLFMILALLSLLGWIVLRFS